MYLRFEAAPGWEESDITTEERPVSDKTARNMAPTNSLFDH
jgi:hypothetical protein